MEKMTKLTNEEAAERLTAQAVKITQAIHDYGWLNIELESHEEQFNCIAGIVKLELAEILQRMAEGAAGEAAPHVDKWPQHCDLCNQNMESETDRIEWHGLGNCVEICDRCTGSGIEPPKVDCPVCQGKGKMPTGSAQVPWKLCPNCKATGKIPSTAGPRPHDKLYVVEHKRDGAWRLHLDMNISTIEAQSILAMQELRRQWPAAEWRVASYVPQAQFFAAAPAEDMKPVTPRCPKCGEENFHRAVQTVRCFGCLTDFDVEGVVVKEEA